MKLDHIALDRLSISLANMRDGKKLPDIADILPSVRARGVLVPLLVRPNGSAETFEIVAGRRRYYAALEVANENGVSEPIPCAIMEAGDDASALEASMLENYARRDPDEVSLWESMTLLVKQGRSVDEISSVFGMEGLRVKRILALGNLLPRIRQAFRNGEIDAASIRHLTLATKAQQKTWVSLFDDPNGCVPRGHNLKNWLFGGSSIPTSVALFDLETYQGRIVTDLFEEQGYFADPDVFLAAQYAAIAVRQHAYIDDGWSDVVMIASGDPFRSWEYEKTPKRKGGRVYIAMAHTGEVSFHEGYLTLKESKGVAKGGNIETVTKTARPEITAAMTSYIDLHRHAAVRAALATQPSLALRLIVAHAICGSPLWRVEVQSQRSRNEAVTASIEVSVAETKFDEHRRAVLAVMGFDPESPEVTKGHDACGGIVSVFTRLLDIPDRAVMEVLAIVMAETLASGSTLIESIGVHIGLDMADYWVADEAFYTLFRDREVLNSVLREVGGDVVAQAHTQEKGKTIKGVINDFLTGANDRTKVERWVPRWMTFPPSAYTQRGGVGTVDRHAALAERGEGMEQPLDSGPAVVGVDAAVADSDTAEVFEDVEDQRLAA